MAATHQADVVVYGGTASGVVASVAAARMGAKVVLLEPGNHIGGMLSGGLSYTDFQGQEQIIGGLSSEVFERIGKHYGQGRTYHFEPHVAERVLNDMLREAAVSVHFKSELKMLTKTAGRIRSIETTAGDSFEAAVFIDAGYEGDLMKAAEVSYSVGREGRANYGETLAGRGELLPGHHQFPEGVAISPWHDGKLLPWIVPQDKIAPVGEGDGKFQSYCFRLCLTRNAANQLPITKPADYKSSDFELLRRYFIAAGDKAKLPMGIGRLPNDKCDMNSQGPVSTNLLGAAWEYPDATPSRRREIWKLHLDWAHGVLWFLQNDPSVPAGKQATARQWALCKDEFTDTGGWPHQLYVREGRRMTGESVLTQADLMANRRKSDVIGMGGYNIDIREVQWVSVRTWDFGRQEEFRRDSSAADRVFMEGYVTQPVQPWDISYRALTPRLSECSNLLVPVCASMSTIAYASFRMEPGYMIAGHAAGAAAALACKNATTVQAVDVTKLQAELRGQGQILETATTVNGNDSPPSAPGRRGPN